MRNNWPIAFPLAACLHAGAVITFAMVCGSIGRGPTATTPLLELRLVDLVEAPVEPAAPPLPLSPPPPELITIAAVDSATSPAHSSPAMRGRSWIADIMGTLRDVDLRSDVASIIERLSARSAALRADVRTIAGRSRSLAAETLRQMPSLPDDSRGSAPASPRGDSPHELPSVGPIAEAAPAAPQPPSSGSSAASGTASGPVPIDGNRPPPYPTEAARRRVEGVAIVVARVSTHGSVVEVRIDRSSGSDLLDAAALAAVGEWRFAPALDHRGAVVECEARLPIEFRLRAR